MSRSKIATVLSVLLLALLIAVGCSEKGGNNNNSVEGNVGSVQIILSEDTLRFLPGDSATSLVTIVVTDDDGTAIPGQKVNVSLVDANLGFIEFSDADLRDTTNSQGRVEAVFSTFGQSGDNTIRAEAGGRSDERTIVIREEDAVVGTLTIAISPQNMLVSALDEDSAIVTVRISDLTGNAIVGINLPLTTTGGRVSALPATDAGGQTQARWYSNADFGTFTIKTRAGGLEDSTSITVAELPSIPGTLEISSTTQQIRADDCVTRATVRAILRDAFGSAISGDTVRFGTPNGGSAQSWAVTDSLGAASVIFCEYNFPSEENDSAIVVARYEPWGLYDTVRIWIEEASSIATFNLTAASLEGTAGIDSIGLNLFASFEDGTPVHGYWARFNAEPCGTFTRDSVLLLNGRPDSLVWYKVCTAIPAAIPEIWASIDTIESNSLFINTIPGDPTRVSVSAPTSALINEVVEVAAAVADSFGNRVGAGHPVMFSASLGGIPPLGQTGADGVARVNYNSGTTSGPALITASLSGADSAQTVISIQSGSANTISLSVSNTSLEVSGTGGQDWSQLQAHVFDANGNPVPDQTIVTFSIIDAPDAPGGTPANIGGAQTATAGTANGIAIVTLLAGTAPGPLSFQACVDVNGAPSCASHNGITIVSGPPAQIFIYPNEIGVDAGGGAWNLEVAVLVVDIYQNPVRSGVAVFMEVVPDSAQIVSLNIFTNNENSSGDTNGGVAYTQLRYLSPNTFDVVTIRARTANEVTADRGFTLPLQDPLVEVRCQPGQWHFPSQGDPCHIRCDAEVQDGHSVSIAGATVFYTTTRGRLHATDALGAPIAGFAITTVQSPGNIWSTLWLVDEATNIFPDPLIAEIPGDCTVEVAGYSDATDSQTINFRRGGG